MTLRIKDWALNHKANGSTPQKHANTCVKNYLLFPLMFVLKQKNEQKNK